MFNVKYNLLMRDENEGIIASIIDGANGKLIIASDNSFLISSIVEELKEAAMSGSFELYNGNTKVNPTVKSEVQIVAVNSRDKGSVAANVVTHEFKIATFTKESKESFSFDIVVEPIKRNSGYAMSGKATSAVSNVPAVKDDLTKILNSIKDNNVVFIQDLTDKVSNSIKDSRDDTTVFANISSFSNDYVITGDDGVMVAKFDAPEHSTIEHRDCMSFVPNALKAGVTVVCNTTWVRFFLELTSIEYEISLSSVVIYNNSDFGPMGNKELYRVDDK
jgi:hypothetical protein